MAASFVVVPQWQGSGSSRAMRLIDGAEAIRGDLPSATTMLVDVPSGAGSDLGTGVHRLSAVQYVRDELQATLRDASEPAVVIGGDCGVEVGAIGHANRDDDVAVVWIDAHPDLNTPESSPSGAFHGMVLRTLLGDGPAELLPAVALRPENVILVGTRAADEAEDDYITYRGIRRIPAADATGGDLAAAIAATGASKLYLHVDLDVLDPAEFGCTGFPEPFGLTVAALLGVIGSARAALPLVGAGITEFAPASAEAASDDLTTILRVISALTKPLDPAAPLAE